jgi:hypothetical protein
MSTTRSRSLCHSQPLGRRLADVTGMIKETGGLGAEIVRHFMLIIGVVGLVAIATGALTDCSAYWSVLNWVSSCFYRG